MSTYKSVVITHKGGPEVLQVVENELRAPNAGEVRVRIQCTGVGYTDVVMRRGYYPFAPKHLPFAPGYEIVGTIDALGEGVTGWEVGQRITALTVTGGYAEYIYLELDELIAVPDGLDAAEVVCLPLNYVTAYQMLHREAKLQPGQTALFTGASGGVGQALLDVGRNEGLTMYGLASAGKAGVVEKLGGIALDYRSPDWQAEVREKTGGAGVDAAFDGLGGEYVEKCFDLVKHGGHFVQYGFTTSLNHGENDWMNVFKGVGAFALHKVFPAGRTVSFYGVTMLYKKDKGPFKEDLPKLFALLAEKKIKPNIVARIPFTEAARANTMLEEGGVGGKIVLDCV